MYSNFYLNKHQNESVKDGIFKFKSVITSLDINLTP